MRKVKNLILRPKTQVTYIMYFLATGMLLLLVVFSFVLFTLTDLVNSLKEMCGVGPDLQRAVQKAIVSSWVMFAFVFTAFVGISVAIGLFVTHRLVGPMVRVQHMIKSLRAGDYTVRGHLRTNDEFHEVMVELNELASVLEKKHGSGVSGP